MAKHRLWIGVLLAALLLCGCGAGETPPREEQPSGLVTVSELMADGGAYASPERVFGPWVELSTGEESLDLSGWSLSAGGSSFTLPEGTALSRGDLLAVWTEELPLRRGDTLELRDAEGALADRLELSQAPAGSSLIRGEAGLEICSEPTPGYENSAAGREALVAALSLDADAVRMSELMAKNRAMLRDEDGAFPDWIELENVSDRAVSLAGWQISDKGALTGWPLPERELAPGERLLLFCSGKDRAGQELHTDFSLSAGEELCLSNARGWAADCVTLTEPQGDLSWTRDAEGGLTECKYPTPGLANDIAGYDRWQESLAPEGPLVISEVMVASFLGHFDNSTGNHDWAEIRNISDQSVYLGDYYLSDDEDDYFRWRLPDEDLGPGEYKLIYCDKDGVYGAACADFSLDSENDRLFLSDGSHVVDAAPLRDIPLEGSFGRMDGENGFFYFASPTPRRENLYGQRRVSAQPLALTPEGLYEGVDSLTVELSSPGTIYYTTDGSAPSVQWSPVYTGPFTITKTTVVSTLAVEENGLVSRRQNLSYFLNEGHQIPVVSLVMDDFGRFSSMYENGQKWLELPGTVSYFDENGSFSAGCGVTMSGMTSLKLPKKNMSLRFRGAYGDAMVDYDIFGGGVTSFSNLTLRAGQDYYSAIIRNELCQELCLQFSDHVVTQRSRYAAVYVNGQYRGLYALKEKVNRQLYASLAGVSKDSVTMQRGPAWDNTDFAREVFHYVLEHDMSQPENYEHFCQVMDVDSLIDWTIMEGWAANADILRGNVKYCRSTENGGQWKVVYYDLDATLLRTMNTFYNLLDSPRAGFQQISRIITPLLKNEQFRQRFLERFSEAIHGPLSDEHVLAEIDRLDAAIEPELDRDLERWFSTRGRYEANLNYLRKFISDGYAQHNIDTVCDILDLTDEERELWFP